MTADDWFFVGLMAMSIGAPAIVAGIVWIAHRLGFIPRD